MIPLWDLHAYYKYKTLLFFSNRYTDYVTDFVTVYVTDFSQNRLKEGGGGSCHSPIFPNKDTKELSFCNKLTFSNPYI